MDGLRDLLDVIRQKGLAKGRMRGVFHVAIGRTVARPDGTVVATGVTWRELAEWLRVLRYETELVRELGADPDTLSPRDRQKFWYSAIALARVDSAAAFAEAAKLADALKPLGFVVGPPPAGAVPATPPVVLPTPTPKVQSPPPPAPVKKPPGKPKK